jgi:hypothetical protein
VLCCVVLCCVVMCCVVCCVVMCCVVLCCVAAGGHGSGGVASGRPLPWRHHGARGCGGALGRRFPGLLHWEVMKRRGGCELGKCHIQWTLTLRPSVGHFPMCSLVIHGSYQHLYRDLSSPSPEEKGAIPKGFGWERFTPARAVPSIVALVQGLGCPPKCCTTGV